MQVGSVTTTDISDTIAVFGQVMPGRESEVATRISGVVDRVGVEVGDVVEAGDVLAEIDSELLALELARAEADLAVSEAAAATAAIAVTNAQTAFDRAENLLATSVISDAAFEQRESELRVAEGARAEAAARVAVARVALRRLQYDYENAVVRAPFGGVVIDVLTEIGQFAAQGSGVARLLDVDQMEVEAAVPARFVGALRDDALVAAVTDAGGEMTLRSRAALPTEFSATRTRPVIFDVVSAQDAPAAGQSVTLQVPVSAPRSALTVPKDAVTEGQRGWQVFVVVDGAAQPRTVEIGQAIGDRFEVVSGLALDDQVVIRGNERLRPGQAVSVMPGGGAPPATGGRPPSSETEDSAAAAIGTSRSASGG